jgi:predicted Fe-Mo cluster-binding NifX family protein
MRVALTIWEDRISPVFDSAHTLMIATIQDSKIIQSEILAFNPKAPLGLIEMLRHLNVKVLICGAISELPANTMAAGGLTLIPFIAGNAVEVIETYARGNSLQPAYLMPGCGGRCPRKRRPPC